MEGMAERAMLERFIEEYGDRAYGFAYRLCGREEDARELVQEAFLRVIDRWDSYDPAQPFENWFSTLIRHIYYDGLKRWERGFLSLDAPGEGEPADASPLAELVADGEDGVEERLERGRRGDLIREAVEALSPKYKALLTLVDLQGRRYEDAAAALDIPLNSVRSGVFRAREALRKALAARLGEEVSHELP